MGNMVKITDVAKAAGVSPSTVSHALNGNRPISQKTKDRVLAVVDRLGYQPNTKARALKSKHSGIIGFFASDITELFVTQIIRGVEKITGAQGLHLLFASGVEFDYDLHKALLFLQRRNIDGIIVSYEISHKHGIVDLQDIDLPIVTINRDISESITSVMPDDFNGGYTAALHLIGKGARKLAVIAGPKDRFASNERLEGFKKGVSDSGLKPDNVRVFFGDFYFSSGYDCAEKLLHAYPDINGLFCANDHMAAGAIDYARRHHIDVPEKLKVIGYDNREFSEFWPTPISTFSQPLQAMGETSAELLLSLIHEKTIPENKILMKSSLIQRHSSE